MHNPILTETVASALALIETAGQRLVADMFGWRFIGRVEGFRIVGRCTDDEVKAASAAIQNAVHARQAVLTGLEAHARHERATA